jgi:gamma-glutamylaminecyclotransferase
MGGKLDILRDELRPGDGVMVEVSYNNWEWGCISAVSNTGFLVEIWAGEGAKWTRFCERTSVYPDDYTWDDEIDAQAQAQSTAVVPTTYSTYSAPDPEHLFVYGTLKRGGRLNSHLKDCEFIQEDVTKLKKYKMFSVGDRFPAVTDWKGTCAIKGEIYRVTPEVMKRLDEVEGVPHLYRRDKCYTAGFDKQCYIYISSCKIELTYGDEFGEHIYLDEALGAHVWEN